MPDVALNKLNFIGDENSPFLPKNSSSQDYYKDYEEEYDNEVSYEESDEENSSTQSRLFDPEENE